LCGDREERKTSCVKTARVPGVPDICLEKVMIGQSESNSISYINLIKQTRPIL